MAARCSFRTPRIIYVTLILILRFKAFAKIGCNVFIMYHITNEKGIASQKAQHCITSAIGDPFKII